MKYVVRALLLLCIVGLVQTVSAQAPLKKNSTEIQKQQILSSVIDLDTLDLSKEKVEIYPDIMSIFQRSSDYPEDYNPYDQFLEPKSVQRGRIFLEQNEQILNDAADKFSIRPEIFVSILRIESDFGEYTHTHQALGAFVSIIYYASNEKRKNWARTQLEALLQLSYQNDHDPTEVQSSYAGAIGLPQFLPTSFLKYSADGNKDGEVDLFDLHDAVWSIGNYLTEHGWHTNQRRSVWLYNHSNRYVACVFQYANAL